MTDATETPTEDFARSTTQHLHRLLSTLEADRASLDGGSEQFDAGKVVFEQFIDVVRQTLQNCELELSNEMPTTTHLADQRETDL